jgi:hypothetical protein
METARSIWGLQWQQTKAKSNKFISSIVNMVLGVQFLKGGINCAREKGETTFYSESSQKSDLREINSCSAIKNRTRLHLHRVTTDTCSTNSSSVSLSTAYLGHLMQSYAILSILASLSMLTLCCCRAPMALKL